MTNRKMWALSVVALALVVTAGGLVASNMGFKLNKTLQATLAGTSLDGTNSIGLPFNPQVGMTTAALWATDMGGLGAGATNVTNIQRFDPSNNGFTIFSGGRSSNFPLEAGVGYRVRVPVGSTRGYIIVGSHDPNKLIALKAAAAGVSLDGTNKYAYPYHSTATNASQLAGELGGLNGVGGPVTNVQRFDASNNGFTIFSGGRSSNFALVPGTGYRVRVTLDTTFTPSHF